MWWFKFVRDLVMWFSVFLILGFIGFLFGVLFEKVM